MIVFYHAHLHKGAEKQFSYGTLNIISNKEHLLDQVKAAIVKDSNLDHTTVVEITNVNVINHETTES